MNEIFPIKGTESKEFTDPEILELIKRSNGEREKERIIQIIEENVKDLPNDLMEKIKNELCDKIIFYFREKVIKRDERGRSILFYEMLEGLGLKVDVINERLDRFNEEIKELKTLSQYESVLNEVKILIEKNSDKILKELKKEVVKEIKREGLIGIKEYSPLSQFLMADYLEFRKEEEPKFFRSYSPIAIDFEKGYVYMRPEVKEIIESLNKKRIICLTGEPASGKTVILHSIGYSLIKDKRDVYLIPLKERRRPEPDEIRKLDREAVLILDDCHLDTSYVEDLLKPPRPKYSLIISSRPLEPPWEEQERIRRRSELYERMKEAIRIKPEDAAGKIIELFSKKKGLEIKEETRRELKKYFSNLMVLSWALETYERYKSVAKEKIYETVKNWLCPLIE